MSKVFNKIINFDEKNLDSALELLMKDIVDANIYNNLVKDLLSTKKENNRLFIESRTFWYLTFQSLKESREIRLCRIFDTVENSISIQNLLFALKENPQHFNKNSFINRLKDNPFSESLANSNRELDLTALEKELNYVRNNKIVKKIIIFRNNLIAHKSLKSGLKQFKILRKEEISIAEVDELLLFCKSTINKYMNLFKAVSWSTTIIGHDDYKGLVKFFNIGMKKYKSDLSEEIKQFSSKKLE